MVDSFLGTSQKGGLATVNSIVGVDNAKGSPIALALHPHQHRTPLRHRGSEARGFTSLAKCAALIRLAHALSLGTSLSHLLLCLL